VAREAKSTAANVAHGAERTVVLVREAVGI